jgi:hypothetical protein
LGDDAFHPRAAQPLVDAERLTDVGLVAQALGQHHGVLGGQGGALARGGRRSVRRVADDHHRAPLPGRHLGQVVGVVAGELQPAGGDEVGGRAAV